MSDEILTPETPPPSTRELSRYVKFYDQNIRPTPEFDRKGIFRQIQNLLKKGITCGQIQTALKNYAADPWRKEADVRMVKHIRSFFTKECIVQWQKPMPVKRGKSGYPVDNSLEGLAKLDDGPFPGQQTIDDDGPMEDSGEPDFDSMREGF